MVGSPAPFAASLSLPSELSLVAMTHPGAGIFPVEWSGDVTNAAGAEPNLEVSETGAVWVPMTNIGGPTGNMSPYTAVDAPYTLWRITGPLTQAVGVNAPIAYPQSGVLT